MGYKLLADPAPYCEPIKSNAGLDRTPCQTWCLMLVLILVEVQTADNRERETDIRFRLLTGQVNMNDSTKGHHCNGVISDVIKFINLRFIPFD